MCKLGVSVEHDVDRSYQEIPLNTHPIPTCCMGRESTTEQSLGENTAELVGWAYRGTHETSNQWIGFT